MRNVPLIAIVGLLVLSLLLGTVNVAAEGTESGTFPDRVFNVIRSPPGGPASDVFWVNVTPARSGNWWVFAERIAGAAVLVETWLDDGGVLTHINSAKLRFAGEESTHTPMLKDFDYKASFKPYGKQGTSVLLERFTQPSPPVADFSWTPPAPTINDDVVLDAGPSTDPDNDIVSFAWDFDDGRTGSGRVVTHRFSMPGTYQVNLSATDTTGLRGWTVKDVIILEEANLAPIAAYTFTRDLMTVAMEGSGSTDLDGTIVDYHWYWGDMSDESSGMSSSATHTYAMAGKYEVILRVTDNGGKQGAYATDVTVNTATADWTFKDFFNVPFGEWWDARNFLYGDLPIGAECFSADGVANFLCFPIPDDSMPDVASYPYVNWYPAPTGDASIYAPYRFQVDAKNHAAFSIERPVVVPSCADLKAALAPQNIIVTCIDPSPLGGSLGIEEALSYVTVARADELANPAGRACPDVGGLNDGFLSELQLTLRMDGTAAAKLFGVTDPTQWTPSTAEGALIKPGCGTGLKLDAKSGVLEQGIKAWFEAQGNGPYDIYSAFRSSLRVFVVEALGSYDMGSGMHTLTVDLVGAGLEALTGRWLYWGATSYRDGVMSGAAPAGLSGMETPFLEGFQLSGTLGASFTGSASGAIQYHFRHQADAGGDAMFGTSDDVPKWVWQPILGDQLPGPVSELNAYAGYSYVHTTPSSIRYGMAAAYDVVPAVWALSAGQTQTFEFPRGLVVLFDPYMSARTNSPSGLRPIATTLTLGPSVPVVGAGSFDVLSRTLSVVGPTSLGTPPHTAGGKPLESRAMYNLVRG